MKRAIATGAAPAWTAAVLGAAVMTSCNLDTSDKTSCETQSDCLDGYVCLAKTGAPAAGKQCVVLQGMPAAPSDVTALPRSGSAVVSWTPVDNATGYIVYSGTASEVYTDSYSATATAPPVSMPLGNGFAGWFYVVATNQNGKSPLSAPACAVGTASDTTGLTLYDPLCAGALDGGRWIGTESGGGLSTMGVKDDAAIMTVSMRNQRPRSAENAVYSAFAAVSTPRRMGETRSLRVTAIAGDVIVPAATASRSGASAVMATLRLTYQPPAQRKIFPGANQSLLLVEVGLIDDGHGLRAYRQASHCDNASCTAFTNAGVAFGEPAGWTVSGHRATSPAAYDTPYHLTVAFDEFAGTFGFTISGGGFGTDGVSGTADPSSYLARAAGWAGVPLAGDGFLVAQMGVSTLDDSPGGGGSGAITARFDNIVLGFDGDAPPEVWDTFPSFSGALEGLSQGWSNGGLHVLDMADGTLRIRDELSQMGTVPGMKMGGVLQLVDPDQVNTLQADIKITFFSGNPRVWVQGRFYNDGSAGTAAPDRNGPGSAVGDIVASVIVEPTNGPGPDAITARYLIARCSTATCAEPTDTISAGVLSDAFRPGVHAARVSWDPVAKRFTFLVDGRREVIDPTAAAPVLGPPNAPVKRIFTTLDTSTQFARMTTAVTNVFVAP